MLLKSIEYSEYEGTPRSWKIEGCKFGNINLIVGKNATGKSRTINLINSMAKLLSGEIRMNFRSGNYVMAFDNGGKKVTYSLHYNNSSIITEKITIGSKKMLDRKKSKKGSIYYEKEDKYQDFQPPSDVLAVTRRDIIQHPFLEDFFEWGKNVRIYRFGTDLGKNQFAILLDDNIAAKNQEINPNDSNMVVGMFLEGKKQYPKEFEEAIINDMNAIGYSIKKIGTSTPDDIVVQGSLPNKIVGIHVEENDLQYSTDQIRMSQGMFRALSLFIQIHYSSFTSTPSCILIDDIGEGLDFERSTALIKLLIERAKNSSIQLIMSTNDRFVMNNVPLEYWLVIKREGGICKILNQKNSPELFDDFKLTGLNNFDFFSSEYYIKDNQQN